jgi:type IX secretion system PorP/SprF family membrane protein
MKRTITTLCLASVAMSSLGQDIHFSQFWASPLNLNPAQTGFIECTYRATAIYRSQWASVNSGNGDIYKTFSLSYDHMFNSPFIGGDIVSLGLVMYNDIAGDLRLSNLSVLLNGAYHKQIGSASMLSLGLQGGMTQKNLKNEFIKFPDMFDPNTQTFIQSLTSDPMLAAQKFSNFDLTIGLQYSQQFNSGTTFHVGAAGLHILTPNETFMNSTVNVLPMRIVGHGGLSVPLNQKMTLNPKVLYMGQGGAQEINIGTDIGYKLQNPSLPSQVYGGLWYRMKDAVIPYFGLDYRSFRLGLSYDVNVSSLTEASHAKGGFEVSLIYVGCLTTTPSVIVVPCIRI